MILYVHKDLTRPLKEFISVNKESCFFIFLRFAQQNPFLLPHLCCPSSTYALCSYSLKQLAMYVQCQQSYLIAISTVYQSADEVQNFLQE